MTRLEVDLPEAAWLGVPVDADAAWAAAEAAQLATGDAAALLAQELEVVVRRVQAVPRPLAAAALLPDVGDGAPTLLAVLVLDEVALDDDLEALVRLLRADAEDDARPPEVTVVELPAGPAVRTHRLSAEPDGVVVEVLEHLLPAGDGTGVRAQLAWLALPLGAGLVALADEVAAGLRLVPDA